MSRTKRQGEYKPKNKPSSIYYKHGLGMLNIYLEHDSTLAHGHKSTAKINRILRKALRRELKKDADFEIKMEKEENL